MGITPGESTQLLRRVSAWESKALPVSRRLTQFSFQSFIGRTYAVPHGCRTLADDGADSNFISEKFLRQVKTFQTIPLVQPVICEGYDGKASESITHRVEFFLKMDTHVERSMAYVVNTCRSFDLVLGFK
jgi:hypothetical protein